MHLNIQLGTRARGRLLANSVKAHAQMIHYVSYYEERKRVLQTKTHIFKNLPLTNLFRV